MTLMQDQAPTTAPAPSGFRSGLGAIGVVFIVLAVILAWWAFMGGGEESALEDLVIRDPVATLVVDADAGTIRVSGSSGQDTVVERTIRGSREPALENNLNGDVLTLTSDCPMLAGNCSVTYDIQVPAEADVRLSTGAGDIEVEDTVGPVQLDTDAGSILMIRLSGEATASTNAGSVTGSQLVTSQVYATSDAGTVQLDFDAAIENVTATTNAGDVIVSVPGGPYNVEANSDTGAVTIDVPTDAASDARIVAETSAGSVTVTN